MRFELLQILVFLSLAILVWFESLGFFFRVGGAQSNNLVIGYTLQNSLAFLSRFWAVLFNSCFAFLADTKNINIGKNFLIYYFILILIFMVNIFISRRQYLISIKKIILGIGEKKNLLILFARHIPMTVFLSLEKFIFLPSFFKTYFSKLSLFFKSKQIDKSIKTKIILFALTYLAYYACWPVIATLITFFPNKPAFLISLASFFNMFSSVYQTLYMDPAVALYKDEETITYIYENLHLIKILMIIFLLIFLIILQLPIFAF